MEHEVERKMVVAAIDSCIQTMRRFAHGHRIRGYGEPDFVLSEENRERASDIEERLVELKCAILGNCTTKEEEGP